MALNFHSVLFVSHGLQGETEGLKQALSIARNNRAELKAVVLTPELPQGIASHKERYHEFLLHELKNAIQTAQTALNPEGGEVQVTVGMEQDKPFVIHYGPTAISVEVESGGTAAERIIRHVLRNDHDLVLKEADPRGEARGFRSVDMELLRKCPCPVFLSRPISKHRDKIQVAVAIDPESLTPEGHDLSLRLLQIARSYTESCDKKLHIVACWEFPFEGALRENRWVKVQEESVNNMVQHHAERSRAALEGLVAETEIGGETVLHHLRGAPDQVIPNFIDEHGINVLVMGTVARSGITGFIIGNTAENILQKINCSLLAMKPHGFISPVKAY